MMQLHQDYQRFLDAGAEVLVTGPDDMEAFQKYWKEHDYRFVGLPDPAHKVADLYGQQVNTLKLGRMPAQFVIDKAGLIRYSHFGGSMRDIPPNQEILDILVRINEEEKA